MTESLGRIPELHNQLLWNVHTVCPSINQPLLSTNQGLEMRERKKSVSRKCFYKNWCFSLSFKVYKMKVSIWLPLQCPKSILH